MTMLHITKNSMGGAEARGFSTIEILIAFAVGIIFLSAAMMVAFSDPTLSRQVSLENGQAAALDAILDSQGLASSSNKFGALIGSITENWSALIPTTHTPPNESDFYAYAAPEVTDISPCIKEILGETSWTSLNDRTHHISFGTALSNIDLAAAIGRGACDPFPPTQNGWDNPENPTWQTSPSAVDGTQTGIDIATIGGIPYVFMTTTHTSQKKDLWVIDVSDVENPTVVASLDTGGVANAKGLVDIDVVTFSDKTFAYVIQNSAKNQLQTIDVSNPTGLDTTSITSTISLEAYGVTPGGTDPTPKVITYYGGKLYIGLYNTTGPELLVFNVASNPASPTFVGSIANSFNHSINDIVINGTYAYLAIKPGTGGGAASTRELMIIDVSHATPVDTGKGFNASSTSNDTEGATALYLIGNTLYLGRERVSNSAERDFYVFDISNPTAPTPRKSKRLGIATGGSMGTPRVIDILVHGHLGFFVTTDSSKPFQVYDIQKDPTDILPVNNECSNYLNLPKLVEIVYRDDLIYGANGNQAALNILRDDPNACTP